MGFFRRLFGWGSSAGVRESSAAPAPSVEQLAQERQAKIERWIEQLRTEESWGEKSWVAAALQLQNLCRDDAQPLLALLQDPSKVTRAHAAFALVGSRDPRRVDPLLVALNDSCPLVRHNVIEAVAESADPRVVPELIKMLPHDDERVWQTAALQLAGIGTPEALEAARSVAGRYDRWTGWNLIDVKPLDLKLFLATIPDMTSENLVKAQGIVKDCYRREPIGSKLDYLTVKNAIATELERRGPDAAVRAPSKIRVSADAFGRAIKKALEYLQEHHASGAFGYGNMPPLDEDYRLQAVGIVASSGAMVLDSPEKMANSSIFKEFEKAGIIATTGYETFQLTPLGRATTVEFV